MLLLKRGKPVASTLPRRTKSIPEIRPREHRPHDHVAEGAEELGVALPARATPSGRVSDGLDQLPEHLTVLNTDGLAIDLQRERLPTQTPRISMRGDIDHAAKFTPRRGQRQGSGVRRLDEPPRLRQPPAVPSPAWETSARWRSWSPSGHWSGPWSWSGV